MINPQFKIILFLSGFAGDLITALHNPDLLKSFDKNTLILDDDVMKLKSVEYRQAHSHEDKIEYLKSIEHLRVCSSHDTELGLRLKDNTTLIHCSDRSLHDFLYNRVKRIKPDNIMSLEEGINWQETNKRIYKNQIDIANIYNNTFLKDLGINNNRSTDILNKWIELNKHD
jgi:hypothetical protein